MSTEPVAFALDEFGYRAVCQAHGIDNDYQAARAFGVERSVVTRVRRGVQRPGNRFMAGVRAAFGEPFFFSIFSVVADEAAHRHRPQEDAA